MSLTVQKFLAVTALAIAVGGIAGWFLGPFATGPFDSDAMNHDFELFVGQTVVFRCGNVVLAQSMFGCIFGALFGLIIGPAVAWWLPTPGERQRTRKR